MAGRRTKLTPEVQAGICAMIRAGAFDWVAAEANGIGQSTFYDWLRWGEGGRKLYAEFSAEVKQAHAQARTTAELEVKRQNPLAWLRLGPGRDRRGMPGWTDQVQVTGDDSGEHQSNVLADILAADPELRERLARAFAAQVLSSSDAGTVGLVRKPGRRCE